MRHFDLTTGLPALPLEALESNNTVGNIRTTTASLLQLGSIAIIGHNY